MTRKIRFDFVRKIPLSTHYFIFASGLILVMVFLSLLTAFFDYQSYKQAHQQELNISANRIEDNLSSILDTTYHMQVFMGRQIAQHGANNLQYIYQLFKNYSEVKNDTQSIYSWPLYDWIDDSKKLVVSARTGIQEANLSQTDFSRRVYVDQTQKYPWKLWISEPLIGFPSGEWVIVASVGITNSFGKYLGSLGVGINTHRLAQALESVVNPNQVNFTVIDDQGKVILTSNDNSLAWGNVFFNPKKLNLTQQQGLLPKPITVNHIIYSSYKKMVNYPYYIVMGTDERLLQQHFQSILLPRLFQFIFVGLISLSLMLLFRRWFIQPIGELSKQALGLACGGTTFRPSRIMSPEIFNLYKGLLQVKYYMSRNQRTQQQLHQSNQELATVNQELSVKQLELEETQQRLVQAIQIAKDSDDAKERFIRQVHADLKAPLLTILQQTQYLIASLEESSINHLQLEHLPFLKNIQTAAVELKAFTRVILDLKPVEIKSLIDESIRIHNKMAFDKKITLETCFKEPFPAIDADALRLKQVLVSLLYRALENTPKNGRIKIHCEYISLAETIGYMKILIEDTGFGLSEADRHRMKAKFTTIDGTDGIELELDAIQKIIELHQGQFHIQSEWSKGTQVTILLPCKQYEPEVTDSNILFLAKKTITMKS